MSIENTALKPRPEWLFGGSPQSIERQEAQGQQQLAQSSQLPVDGLTPELAARHQIEMLGPSHGDALFMDVRFPIGTVIKPTNHDMWSDLYAGDTKIASIFYKAAFYDRGAFIRFEQA